jgi:hypothetical protein
VSEQNSPRLPWTYLCTTALLLVSLQGVRDKLGRFADASQPNVNNAIDEYSRSTVTGAFKSDINGYLFADTSEACEAAAPLLYSAVVSFADGTFDTCHMSTPTTSPTTSATTSATTSPTSTPTTTSATTSPTSTPTTTPQRGRFQCFAFGGSNYVEVEADESCEAQVALINSLLEVCTGSVGEYACDDTLMLSTGDHAFNTAALKGAINEYTRGDNSGDITLANAGHVTSDTCTATVAIVNDMIDDVIGGTFADCQVRLVLHVLW